MDDEVKLILRRADELRSARANFDWHWQEVADYMLPSREFTRSTSPGQKRLTRIYNTLPVLACEQLAGGLHGMLTSPALRWFQLQVRSRDLRADDEAQRWFSDTTDRLYDHFNSQEAGFATAAHEFYLDTAAFGTAVMYVPDLGDNGSGFRPVPLLECYISENAGGRIDTLFRCYKMTRRQVLEQWPDLSHAEFRKAAGERPDEHVEVVHAVTPEKAKRRMPWRSVYVVRSPEVVLERGGYRSFPYVVARWSKRSGEIYGNSAGMNALPDVKLLNKIEEVTLRAGQKAVDPPLMVPDDGFLNPLDTRPGGVNVYRVGLGGQPADKIAPLDTGSRPDLGEKMAERCEARVKSTFYSDWMNLPRQPNMTATEVIQRRDEMLRLLGPMVSRLTAEMLGPIIERTFRIHLENGLLAPLPPQLAGADWRIEYLSPLAISQKSSDADAVLRWFTIASQMAAVDPSVLDTMDMGEAARFLADRYNAPPTLMRTREEAAARGAERAQAEQAAQGVQMADTAARAFKTGAQGVGELAAVQQPGAA